MGAKIHCPSSEAAISVPGCSLFAGRLEHSTGGKPNPSSRWTAVGFEPSTFSICMLKVWCSNQLSHLLLKVSNTVGTGYDVPQMILLIKVSCLLVFFPKTAGISKNCLLIEKKKVFWERPLPPRMKAPISPGSTT